MFRYSGRDVGPDKSGERDGAQWWLFDQITDKPTAVDKHSGLCSDRHIGGDDGERRGEEQRSDDTAQHIWDDAEHADHNDTDLKQSDLSAVEFQEHQADWFSRFCCGHYNGRCSLSVEWTCQLNGNVEWPRPEFTDKHIDAVAHRRGRENEHELATTWLQRL